METTATPTLSVDYFDGHSARARRVSAHMAGNTLYLRGDGIVRSVPLSEVQWPERSRHGSRVAHLSDGASLHSSHAAAWDAWLAASGRQESIVVRAQHSWRWVGAAALVLLVLCSAMYLWGLPWVSRGVVAFVPVTVDRTLGDVALDSIGSQWLQPSALTHQEQQRLTEAFDAAVRKAYPGGQAPAYRISFHKSRIGPNAFALPGGTIVVTDELVQLVQGKADTIVGVLAHELGHVEHRHGMRALVQTTLLGVAASLAFGDFSGWLATAPVLLGQAAYSRDAEREADQASIRILKAAGISPLAMVHFFEQLRKEDKSGADDSTLGIAFASHPPDAERIRRFQEAAREVTPAR